MVTSELVAAGAARLDVPGSLAVRRAGAGPRGRGETACGPRSRCSESEAADRGVELVDRDRGRPRRSEGDARTPAHGVEQPRSRTRCRRRVPDGGRIEVQSAGGRAKSSIVEVEDDRDRDYEPDAIEHIWEPFWSGRPRRGRARVEPRALHRRASRRRGRGGERARSAAPRSACPLPASGRRRVRRERATSSGSSSSTTSSAQRADPG